MSKRVKNVENEANLIKDETPRFFGAVIDVESRYGTMEEIGKGTDVQNIRYFNNKFVDTPEKALAVACDVDSLRHKYPFAMHDVMKEVEYDKENNEYVMTVWNTRDYHTPTPKQWKRFRNGEAEFRLIRDTYRIQIYETSLVKRNLIPGARNTEFLVTNR